MAILSASERQRILAYIMRDGANLSVPNLTKSDVQAAIDATDAWIDTNASSFNTALPAAFRNNANLVQKTLLFCYVAMRRAGILKVTEDS